ncbi:PREDICTED: rho GTPase-activating protein 100F isoform X1 [Papilio polytes]|uniref:rho GTPase-activating protein 100F isoform X1 n=1 Tax=Papilio polytes TaxID=76194 RepID=UPI0006769261|nr:PREDICTED: rho GTPase-activating protein 100F isoform X1 [Papilio polytes]
MQWRKLARLKSSPGGQSRARRMLCCGRRKENGRAAPDLTASPGRAPPGPPQPARANHAPPCVLQPDFRKVSGVSNEIFRQIEMVENDHDATTAAALEAVERRGEMIVRILELRQVGRNNIEAAKKFFSLQDTRHIVQLVEIVKRPGQTLGLYIREGDGGGRTDGVFISRIALESAVYNSGCLKVGDEILAVNLVDVRRMSLDDVVIIMSIPRRLLLCTRQRKGKSGPGSPSLPRAEHKPPPVVVLKRDCRDDDDRDRDRVDGLYSQHGTLRSTGGPGGGVRPVGDGREERNRLQLGTLSPDATPLDLYYNSRPPSDHSTWSYRPPPPVITEQPKSTATHFVPYERSYPNTLESLAEKVHSFYPQDSGSTRFGGRVPRSGSEQQLPRAETHADFGRHSLLRSSLKASAATGGAASLSRYNHRYGGVGMTGPPLPGSGLTGTGLSGSGLGGSGLPSGLSTTGLSGLTGSSLVGSGLSSTGLGAGLTGTGLGSTLGGGYGTTGLGLPSYSSKFGTTRRNRSLDYSSDTEATAPTRTPYYSGLSGYRSSTLGRDIGSKFNSLPRDVRGTGQRLGLSRRAGSVLQDEPEPLSSRLDLRSSRGRLPSSPSVFTSDEYRAWLSRAPSTSALYETLRPRLPTHYSAENIHDALKNMESGSRFGSSLGLARRMERPRHLPARSLSSQQLGPSGSPSTRRVRQLLELGSRFNCPNPSPVPTPSSRHHRASDFNVNDYVKYKPEKPGLSSSMTGLSRLSGGGLSGMLWIHLSGGKELRTHPTGHSPDTPPSGPLAPIQPPVTPRDLYCVLECDRVHKARTVVRTGELNFEWDESFELELVDNRQLDVLVYSWDPQHRHKLCYRGFALLPDVLTVAPPLHQVAIKLEPRGLLYVKLRHTEPNELFRRRPATARIAPPPLFGAELESVVAREVRPSHAPPVPLIVRRCVEEIERRGLDIIGLYRLCGAASKKRILREAFERNARGVELTPDSVPDINVITGLLKDYLRELPQPLFSRCLYQMTLDALGVCLPDDREGNARLMASIVECLPRAARATLVFLLDHLALVVAAQDRNKMSPQHLAVALAPPLMLHSQPPNELDYKRPIHVLQCLLQIWPPPKRSVRRGEPATGPRGNRVSASPAGSATLPPGRVLPSASPYRPQAAASAASPPPALLARHGADRSPPAHVLSSVRGGQYRPQSPLRGPLPAPPRSRQVTVSSPGSPSSSSGSHSPADTIKHGGSVSSILRQPERAASPRASPRNSPRASPRDSPRTPRESTPRDLTPRDLTPRDLTPREMTPRDLTPREMTSRESTPRESPRSAIPGTSAGLAVTLNSSAASGGLSPRYSSTNPFLQQYDAEEEAEAWRAADIFSSPSTHT